MRDHFATFSSLTIRFTTSDNPDKSITEAGVDAFRIVDAQCTPATWNVFGSGAVPSVSNGGDGEIR